MKRAYSSRKYAVLVNWIAYNDNDGEHEPIEHLCGYLTVKMIADCYRLTTQQVATDVWNIRHTASITITKAEGV